jgi:hypothetical protein
MNYFVVNTNDIIELAQQKIQNFILSKLKEKGFKFK